MKFKALLLAAAVAIPALVLGTPASATVYGVYGDASAASVLLIKTRGDTASILGNLSAGSLAGINVLWVLNADNSAQTSALRTYAADIASFVASGGTFAYNDRNVTYAAAAVPGASGIGFVRSPASNIDVVTSGTVLTNGPGGVINNSTLDGGNSSDHGYADISTLPYGATTLLGTGTANQAVAFSFQDGIGHVYYSSIPLDYYLGGYSPIAFKNAYAPNLVAYLDSITPVPEPASVMLLTMGLLGLGLLRRRN